MLSSLNRGAGAGERAEQLGVLPALSEFGSQRPQKAAHSSCGIGTSMHVHTYAYTLRHVDGGLKSESI